MTVLGIDLSLTATGMSDGTRTWLLKSTGHKGDDLTTRCRRLRTLRDDIVDQAHQLTDGADNALIVIEGPSLGQARQGGQHDRAGLWWLVVERLRWEGHHVAEAPPAALKKYATGKGNANKGAMIEATTRRFPDIETGGDDNRCDALWLAALGRDHLGQALTAMPAANRASLASIRWPEQQLLAS